MSTGRHSFKFTDLTRAVRALEGAGKKITGVTLKNGMVTVLVDGAQPAAGENQNEWDEDDGKAPTEIR